MGLISLTNIGFGFCQTSPNWVKADAAYENNNYKPAIVIYTQCIKSNDDKYNAFWRNGHFSGYFFVTWL